MQHNKVFYECNNAVIPCHGVLLPLVSMAQFQGVLPSKILKGTGLRYEDLLNNHLKVSFDQIDTCVDNVFSLLPHNEFSFQIGKNFFYQNHTPIKTALINASSLNQAIRIISLYAVSFFPYCKFDKFVVGDKTHFVISHGIKHSSEFSEQFFIEILISKLSSYLNWRFPDCEITIELPFTKPTHYEQYFAYIKFPVAFSKPLFLITLKSDSLNIYQQDSCKLMRQQALQDLKLTYKSQTLLSQLARLITEQPTTTLESASDYFSLSPATFKRKLKQHNTNFKYEKDLAQKNETLFHLMHTSASNQTLSDKLAISDLTNFRRMFKRWTGKTPSELRLAK